MRQDSFTEAATYGVYVRAIMDNYTNSEQTRVSSCLATVALSVLDFLSYLSLLLAAGLQKTVSVVQILKAE